MIQSSEEKTEDYGTKFLEDSMSLISKSQISDMLKTTQHQLIVWVMALILSVAFIRVSQILKKHV